jgi:demethylmenaquinone methyltransferase/2-methoxy-6-polyprenyl-1,4-benzoquinol methylase
VTDDNTIEYYRKRAGEYEKIYFRDVPARQAELARLYDMSRRTLAGRVVLDLACGTGFWAAFLSGHTAAMVGLDINMSTLAEACRKQYAGPVAFILADVNRLPVLPGSFDGVLLTFLLSHVKRQEIDTLGALIREVARPQAKIFLCDNNLICELVPEVLWDEAKVNSFVKRRLENGEEYLILKNYFDRDELIERFSRWGRIDEFFFERYYWGVSLTHD